MPLPGSPTRMMTYFVRSGTFLGFFVRIAGLFVLHPRGWKGEEEGIKQHAGAADSMLTELCMRDPLVRHSGDEAVVAEGAWALSSMSMTTLLPPRPQP